MTATGPLWVSSFFLNEKGVAQQSSRLSHHQLPQAPLLSKSMIAKRNFWRKDMKNLGCVKNLLLYAQTTQSRICTVGILSIWEIVSQILIWRFLLGFIGKINENTRV
jgi:hypothetical protein